MNNLTVLILLILIVLIILGGFAYIINQFFKSEKQRRNFELKLKYAEDLLPHKLQAYERMALFLERIKPSSLLRRVTPTDDIQDYQYHLIENIQTEFEHNLAQQIYINPQTWEIIFSAKNATQLLIKECVKNIGEAGTSKILQEEIIKQSIQDTPSTAAILYLQKDIQNSI